MRLLGAFAITAAALLAALVVARQPASASCAAPTVRFKPTRVARGGVLTVTGQYFGDACLDTGTLPQGVGPLGDPLTGLVIVIDQGEHEFVVASGSAGRDYSFHVDVVVPAGLQPGAATLALLGAGDARLTDNLPLVISNAPAPSAGGATVATFGPPTTDAEPPGTVPPPVLPGDIPDPQVATVPPLSTTPIADDGATTDHRRAIGVGTAVVVAIGATVFGLWSISRRRG